MMMHMHVISNMNMNMNASHMITSGITTVSPAHRRHGWGDAHANVPAAERV